MESHLRADEGIKRGPRNSKLDPLDRRVTDNQAKLPQDLDYAPILERISQGELMSFIAREMGVTPQALSARLAGNPEYIAARESGHAARLDEAEEWTEGAQDALELARARDVWRARSWRASVEYPARWGDKRQVTLELTGDLGERIRRAQERVIEGEAVAIEQIATPASDDCAEK